MVLALYFRRWYGTQLLVYNTYAPLAQRLGYLSTQSLRLYTERFLELFLTSIRTEPIG